jgi:hypothetical protein
MFKKGFEKVAGIMDTVKQTYKKIPAHHLDQAGLGLLAAAPAYHGYKAIKNKDKGEAGLAASELGGLGLLSAAVKKAHS